MILGYLQSIPSDILVLARQVQADPGFIVGPIAAFFGFILDMMFRLVYSITPNNSLGFAIILLTIIAMTLMLPLGIKAQKSMTKMQQLGPEVDKIKAKYGGKPTDPEIKRKMDGEIQALYSKNKINPLGGCLPMLIQMPLFFALLYIMQQSFLYVGTLNDLYMNLAEAVQAYPGYQGVIWDMAMSYIPQGWQNTAAEVAAHFSWIEYNGVMVLEDWNSVTQACNITGWSYAAAVEAVGGNYINIANTADLSRVLNRFQPSDWEIILREYPAAYAGPIHGLYEYKNSIEIFFGLNLIENSGMSWPGVIVPFFTVITTLGQSWLSQLVNKPKDDKAKTQQTIMMVIMPIFMGFITITMPAGVGLYWIFSNLFRLIQQIVMNSKQGIKFRLPFAKASEL
ncbi:MAG: YidC/Oxa1 family membrane protein insertase [Defluviitaleaceae bacterium]|nr:YidC/Oxa1 family membrane protein insertase [Defluviitaleaceae bacterium]